MLLVELDLEELLEQSRETERLYPEQLSRDACIEDVIDVPAIILVQQSEVVISVVKYNLDIGILEYVAECFRHSDGERIDDGAAFARRDLQQVDSVDEPVEACAFGID